MQTKTESVDGCVNRAITARLGELIDAAERLRRTIESERPAALLPTFILLRAGVAVDAMATELSEHAAKLIPSTGAKA